MQRIFKVFRADEWAYFKASGSTSGSPDDIRDGFIHFSTGAQLRGTVEKHFAGEEGLWLVVCDVAQLGEDLRWEESRGGALFPHLYRRLHMRDVSSSEELKRRGGRYFFEEDVR